MSGIAARVLIEHPNGRDLADSDPGFVQAHVQPVLT
jgi:hypothetical protein